MTRALEQINGQRQPGQPRYTYKIFDSYVTINFNATIERRVFEQQPAQTIRRRHSVSRQQPQNHEQQQQTPQPGPSNRKRAASVGHQSYIAPEELRSVIDSYRNSIGEFMLYFIRFYRIFFF